MTFFLKGSPLPILKEIYEENLVTYGDYYTGSLEPPPDVIEKILSGKAITLLSDITMAPYRHIFSELSHEVNSGPAGYFYQPSLPMKDEIKRAILHFTDTGVIQQVSYPTVLNRR